MEVEDDDLMALRSAALASLSSKPPKIEEKDEDDLEALRLAALMTRKQNQKIQVIYKAPVQKQMPHMNPIMFRKPWTTTNLISLTPDPNAGNLANRVGRFTPRHAPPAPVTKSIPPVIENKVPDKFSRYNSDSSSEDDDDHGEKQKNDVSDEEDEQSDAESVKSGRSFSSVSDVEEAKDDSPDEDAVEEDKEPENEEKDKDDKENGKSDNEDNISIIEDEEEDILAAIDDFLEDRPVKVKQDEKKPEKERKGKKQDLAEKVDSKKPAKRTKSRSSSNSSKASSTETKKVKGQKKDLVTSVKKPMEGKSPKTNQKVVKSLQKKQEKQSEMKTTNDKRNPAKIMQQKRPVNKDLQRELNNGVTKSSRDEIPARGRETESQRIQVVMRKPPSPPRQRRDSDLDSVGTSDLSFLSSEGEDEVKAKHKSSSSTNRQKRKTKQQRSDDRDSNSKSSASGERQLEKRKDGKLGKDKITKPNESRRGQEKAGQNEQNNDLRKKLESRGLKKKTEPKKSKEPTETLTPRNSKSGSQNPVKTLTHVTKTGVISLKKKSMRIPEKPSSPTGSRENSPPFVVSLPDMNEARRIIITRPNNPAPSSVPTDKSRIDARKKIKMKREIKTDVRTDVSSSAESLERTRKREDSVEKKPSQLSSRRRSVLAPNTTIEKKRQKITEVTADRTPEKEKQDDDNESDDSESSSSSNEEVVEEEEVFAFDDSSLPLFDEVLGNVDLFDDGEYVTDKTKAVRKYSRSKSKTKKKRRASPAENSTYKNFPDSRRIVPKSSAAGFYDDGDSKGRRDKAKDSSDQPSKKSVHLRLGRLLVDSPSQLHPGDRSRSSNHSSIAPSPRDGSEDARNLNEDYEEEEESIHQKSSCPSPKRKNAKVVSSSVRIPSKQRWSGESDDQDNLSDVPSQKESRKNDTVSKKRKRKIKVAGKIVREQQRSSDSQSKKKTEKRRNVQDRLGKVILSSVLQQPPVSSKSRRVIQQPIERSEKKKSNKRRKRDKERRKDNGEGEGEDVLEARIRRIQEQNGQIIRRQQEIELEKQKFGF